jgi:uroporphyrinogen III methyltransferase / synthase
VTTSRAKKKFGTVAFVGAGPGDPALLTVRASELLADADVLVAHRELTARIRHLCRSDVEVLDAPADGGEHVRAAVAAAKDGRRVVRLFAGDPTVFCGFAVEADTCAKAKVPFELVPGISSALAVPGYAGVPVTDRKRQAVHVVDLGDDAPEPDWSTIGGGGTVVLLNCGRGIGKAAAALVEHGRRADTPVAVTVDGTTTQQLTITSTLDTVERDAAGIGGDPIVVVGDVVKLREKLSWWETKPLFGWRVLVPRTKEQAGALSEQLASYGAIPVEVPTIAVEPPRTPQAMDRAIRGLVSGRYAWVAFTSVNAVKAVREKLEELSLDARALAGVKIACVGDQTAEAVREWGIRPELVPTDAQSSEGLLAEFPAYDAVFDALDRVFLPRADIATETLAAGLLERGWQVDDVTAYRTVRAAPPPADIREAIKTGGFDAVLFTSSSTVRNLVGIAGKPHASSVIAVIGPATAETAEELGLRVDVTAPKPSASLLAEALAEFGRERRENDDTLPPGKANRAKATARLKKSSR